MRYDNRGIHSVSVGNFIFVQGHTGPLAVTTIRINLSADGRNDLAGPGVEVKLGVPVVGAEAPRELRDRAVQLAYEMIQRLAQENPVVLNDIIEGGGNRLNSRQQPLIGKMLTTV